MKILQLEQVLAKVKQLSQVMDRSNGNENPCVLIVDSGSVRYALVLPIAEYLMNFKTRF